MRLLVYIQETAQQSTSTIRRVFVCPGRHASVPSFHRRGRACLAGLGPRPSAPATVPWAPAAFAGARRHARLAVGSVASTAGRHLAACQLPDPITPLAIVKPRHPSLALWPLIRVHATPRARGTSEHPDGKNEKATRDRKVLLEMQQLIAICKLRVEEHRSE
jgi:hypothetical protein